MDKKWIAFFSQTGSEIVALSKMIGCKPDLMVTNNINETTHKIHSELYPLGTLMRAKHDRIVDYFANNSYYNPADTIITLHGYLRILPAPLCSKYRIYNGHPGAIELYPELKGKDPQVRAWENKGKYKFVGSVVHEVVPEVDEGKIIKSVNLSNTMQSLDDAYSMLKLSSLSAWMFAMKELGVCA